MKIQKMTEMYRRFPVVVNFDLSVEGVIEDGGFKLDTGLINSQNYPTARSGTQEIVIQIYFECFMVLEDVLSELDRQGLRPAELHELLALGKSYPDLQRGFPVAALGSVWKTPHGYLDVPCLYRSDRRVLGQIGFSTRWRGPLRFAAVPK